MLNIIEVQLYNLSQWADSLVSQQLNHLSWLSLGILFSAGLLTSLTPCMLSMLPLTIAYIGGYEDQGRLQAAWQSTCFALGLATTLAGLGIFAAALGQVYGKIGLGLPIFVSVVAILMGLNLLEIIPLRFPAWGGIEKLGDGLPKSIRSYLLGLSFGLVASPCSTPVLATLLAWVGTTGDLILGGMLLLAYAVGYVAPLILTGIFTATIKQLLELRRWSGWINPVSGAVLVSFGVFSLLSRLPGNLF